MDEALKNRIRAVFAETIDVVPNLAYILFLVLGTTHMAYLKTKLIKGKTYFYICESRRRQGKVRSETIAFLGQSISLDDEISNLRVNVLNLKTEIEAWKIQQLDFEKYCKEKHAWEAVPPRIRTAKRMPRERTGFANIFAQDTSTIAVKFLNLGREHLQQIKDEIFFYHGRAEKITKAQSAITRLEDRIKHLSRIQKKYPAVTVSPDLAQAYSERQRALLQERKSLDAKIKKLSSEI